MFAGISLGLNDNLDFLGVPSIKYLAEGEKKTPNLTTGLSLLKLVELLASPWLSTINQLLYMDVSRPGAHLNPIGFLQNKSFQHFFH